MNSVFKKTVCSLMTLFFVPTLALALDAEYKNSLTKVELKQTSDSSYDVNLYMQKKFTEPVKVIKKSDLNYYILLPETKNSASGVAKNGSDIKDASANSHKYAGADVNNGYTKININTTKPINFNINVKNSKDATASAPTSKVAQKPATIKVTSTQPNNSSAEAKSQKKNSDFQQVKKQVVLKSKKEIAPKKPVVVEPTKVKIQPTKKPVAQPVAQKKALQQPVAAKKPAQQPVKKAPVQAAKPKAPAQPKQQPIAQPKPIQEEVKPVEQPIQKEVPPVLETEDFATPEAIAEPITEPEIETPEPIAEPDIIDPNFNSSFKQRFISKITEYGLSINDIIFMLFASLVSVIALIIILRKPSPNQAKIRSKADLIGKLDKTERFVPKKTKEKPEEGKYFVFDKNVKQTAFCEPATYDTKKHYELSNYDPDINIKYGKETASKESEYDIIQKILKEDSLVEIAPGEFEPKIYAKRSQEESPVSAPIKKEPTAAPMIQQQAATQVIEKEESAPKVLSNIEIAPERGFMVVSYNNNVNLMGYIFDDVFALYNFKRSELINPEIKYRLSDKDDKGTNFIIKVEDTKVVVRVTKSQMNLLVVM